MKLLYSLIFSFFISSSLLAVDNLPSGTIVNVGDDFVTLLNGTEYLNTNNCYGITTFFYASASAIRHCGTTNKIEYTFTSASGCNLGDILEGGVCVAPRIDDLDDNNNGVPNRCDPAYVDYLTMDCNDDGVINSNDPNEAPYPSLIPNRCNPDFKDYLISDCNQDGDLNNIDKDIDGDTLPNAFDDDVNNALTPAQQLESPSCAEMKAIEEQKCFIGEHNWNCHEQENGVDFIIDNDCGGYDDPCEKYLKKLITICPTDTHQITDGQCSHDNFKVTKNAIKCEVIPPTTTPVCRATIFEEINDAGNGCDCIDGYARNSRGNCWKTNPFQLDANQTATPEQLATNEQAQAVQDEQIKDLEKTEELTEKEKENASKSLELDESRNDILGAIADELNPLDEEDLIDGALDNFTKIQGAMDLVENGFTGIGEDFTNMKNRVENGFTAPTISSGGSSVLSASAFGVTIDIDPCPMFSQLRGVFYYVFSLMFLWLSIRFYYVGFKLTVGAK